MTIDEKIMSKQIAKEILIEMIRTNNLQYDDFSEAKTPVDLICSGYEAIYKKVSEL